MGSKLSVKVDLVGATELDNYNYFMLTCGPTSADPGVHVKSPTMQLIWPVDCPSGRGQGVCVRACVHACVRACDMLLPHTTV